MCARHRSVILPFISLNFSSVTPFLLSSLYFQAIFVCIFLYLLRSIFYDTPWPVFHHPFFYLPFVLFLHFTPPFLSFPRVLFVFSPYFVYLSPFSFFSFSSCFFFFLLIISSLFFLTVTGVTQGRNKKRENEKPASRRSRVSSHLPLFYRFLVCYFCFILIILLPFSFRWNVMPFINLSPSSTFFTFHVL